MKNAFGRDLAPPRVKNLSGGERVMISVKTNLLTSWQSGRAHKTLCCYCLVPIILLAFIQL